MSKPKKATEDTGYKTITIPCKVCAVEFEIDLPLHLYETLTADGLMEFAGTCPDCRKDDPFLRMMDKAGIPTLGRGFARRKR